jgi:hypothetical protein
MSRPTAVWLRASAARGCVDAVGRWDDDDGAGGVVDAGRADRSQQGAPEPAPPAAAGDEQVGVLGGETPRAGPVLAECDHRLFSTDGPLDTVEWWL